MQITLRLNLIQKNLDSDSIESTIKNSLIIILRQFSQLSIVQELSFFGISGKKKLGKIKSWNQLIDSTRDWKEDVYKIAQNQDGKGGNRIQVQLREVEMMFVLSIKPDIKKSNFGKGISEMIMATKKAYSDFKNYCFLENRSGIEIYDVEYPQSHGILNGNSWSFSEIVDFIDLRYYKQSSLDEWNTVQSLLDDDTLNSIEKEEFFQLIILRWVNSLENESLISKQLQTRDEWLIKNIGVKIEENEDGYVDPFDFEVLPPLTFYDTENKTGYKAVVLDSDGNLDSDLVKQIQLWVQEGSLENDLDLEYLNLILPDRESAVAIQEFADSIGINRVFYSDDDGELWSPN